LLRLLSLLQTPRDWSGAELANRLGVSTRTVRNDIERLRGLGYPVHGTRGSVGGYRLGAGADLPPLLLDDEEAVAVTIGLRTAATGAIAGIEQTSLRALAKLERVLPRRLRRRVNAIQAATIAIPPDQPAPTIDASMLSTLAGACRDHERLRFDYRDHGGASSRRDVEPHRLVLVGRRWYLAAWDRSRSDWRTFRVDRVAPPVELAAGFVPRPTPEDDVAAYVTRSVTTGRFQARVILHVAADVARKAIPPAYGAVTEIDAKSCRLVAGTSSLDGTVLWLGMSGFRFAVEGPPELARRVREVAARLRT
jgi:predicted DNA-binding transcriptional regulator YafY